MTDRRDTFPGDTLGPEVEQPAGGGAPVPPAPLRSEQLLQGRRMVEITHNGETYRLQATRLGKLILTK